MGLSVNDDLGELINYFESGKEVSGEHQILDKGIITLLDHVTNNPFGKMSKKEGEILQANMKLTNYRNCNEKF